MSSADNLQPSPVIAQPVPVPSTPILPNGKPSWLGQLAGWCTPCQRSTRHLAFIETKIADGTIQISDYHFCTNCKAYYQTLTAKANYDLFYANTLSQRPTPVMRDSQYDVITAKNAPNVMSNINVQVPDASATIETTPSDTTNAS